MKIYKCDGRIPATETEQSNGCQNTTEDVHNWITIGSEDGESLQIKNGKSYRHIIETNSYRDLHFCSSECFMYYFFKSHFELNQEGK